MRRPSSGSQAGLKTTARAIQASPAETEPASVEHPDESRQRYTEWTKLDHRAERSLLRKIDLRLCTIAGILSSLNLIDSSLISSASVTSLFQDINLAGDRYSQAIWVYTIAYIAFQYPSSVLVRVLGPRLYFAGSSIAFGLVTLGTGFITTWWQMYILRIFLGVTTAGTFSGLQYVVSTWYKRNEQALRYAFLQSGEVIVLATGGIVNYGLQTLDGAHGLAGWRYMFIVQGALAVLLGFLTYFWIPALPDAPASASFHFLDNEELSMARLRIQQDRQDLEPTPYNPRDILTFAADIKVWGFAVLFFCQNVVSTALSYFLPQILQKGMGFSSGTSIVLSQPPYYYASLPVLLTCLLSDRLRLRTPFIFFNCACLIAGLLMLGKAQAPAARYAGTFLATGAYVSNWAALSAYTQNNVSGQWKRAFTAAVVTMFNGAGGVAGSYIFKQTEAPRYPTAIWVGVGSQILICLVVAVMSTGFWLWNRRRSKVGGWSFVY